MFEFEVNYGPVREDDFTHDILDVFTQHARDFDDYDMLSILQWEEHCTECAMPECYRTCDLYEPRKDGKCRRFERGIIPLDGLPGRSQPVVRIDFKRWGSLMATNRLALIDCNRVQEIEHNVRWVEDLARAVPDRCLNILGRRGISSRLVTRYKNRLMKRVALEEAGAVTPDGFLVEIFNPAEDNVDVTLVVRAKSGEKNPFPYQHRMMLQPGYAKVVLDYSDIRPHVDPDELHFISITPNSGEDNSVITLYFGMLGLFRKRANGRKPIKVVAWDLDNTLWEGILVEDGAEKLRLKENIGDVIEELDRRGIVNTLLSKNDYDAAWDRLEQFGLAEYFLFPQISWSPKSQGMGEVISSFNVGEDAIAFIDDSEFERAEVIAQFPRVTAIDALEYEEILNRPEFMPEISSESSRRREYYRNQNRRMVAQEGFSGQYLDFVRDCNLKLVIAPGSLDNLERVHELVQRTNQLNFSGNRYSREELRGILADSLLDTYTLQCKDRFGDYGTVGFSVVDRGLNRMIDFALSCRVQSKRVEHAFLIWLLDRYLAASTEGFSANYNMTERNAPAGKVFADLCFEAGQTQESLVVYRFGSGRDIPHEDIITVTYEEPG